MYGLQVKRAEARAEHAWFNWHPDKDIKDTHFVSDLLADVEVRIFVSPWLLVDVNPWKLSCPSVSSFHFTNLLPKA